MARNLDRSWQHCTQKNQVFNKSFDTTRQQWICKYVPEMSFTHAASKESVSLRTAEVRPRILFLLLR
jgi:hypothetical protein